MILLVIRETVTSKPIARLCRVAPRWPTGSRRDTGHRGPLSTSGADGNEGGHVPRLLGAARPHALAEVDQRVELVSDLLFVGTVAREQFQLLGVRG